MENCRLATKRVCYEKRPFSPSPHRQPSTEEYLHKLEKYEDQLERYEQQNEELEMRAVSAEMEATHLRLDVSRLKAHVSLYEDTVGTLNKKLTSLMEAKATGEQKLQKFHRKLGRIRVAVTKEINKLKRSEGDLQLAFDSITRYVTEFKNGVMSRTEFLSAVSLVCSALKDQTSPTCAVSTLPVFANAESAKLSLSGQKTHLQALMSMLNEQEYAITDEEKEQNSCKPMPKATTLPVSNPAILTSQLNESSLSGALNSPGKALPVLSRKTPHMALSESDLDFFKRDKDKTSYRSLPVSKLEEQDSPCNEPSCQSSMQWRPSLHEDYVGVSGADTDSDDSDDFMQFTPPKGRLRYKSEPFIKNQLIQFRRERRASSPFPQSNTGVNAIKKSSPILTKRPPWFLKPTKKYLSEVSFNTVQTQQTAEQEERRVFNLKSRSLDSIKKFSIMPKQVANCTTSCDSDDKTGGTLDSIEYSKPYEHLLWKKLGLEDCSALSGSLPCLDKVTGNNLDDSDGYTYVDPKELEDYCERRLGSKEFTNRIRTRLNSTSSTTYLTLSNIQQTAKKPQSEGTANSVAEEPSTLSLDKKVGTVGILLNVAERWRRQNTAIEGSCSGYSTDASSGIGEFDNEVYINPLRRSQESSLKRSDNLYDRVSTSLLQHVNSEDGNISEDEIYEKIDDFSDNDMDSKEDTDKNTDTLPVSKHTVLQPARSAPVDEKTIKSLYGNNTFPPRDFLHARLNDGYWHPPNLPPPDLPPRPLKILTSLNPRLCERRDLSKSKVPGIGPLPVFMTLKDEKHKVQLVPLVNESPNLSQDEHSSGKSVATNLHNRFVISHGNEVGSNDVFTSPSSTSSTPILPRHKKLSRTKEVNLSPRVLPSEHGSGSGSDVTSPPVESSLDVRTRVASTNENIDLLSHGGTAVFPSRSNLSLEKSGYLKKMDPVKLKNWNRRWFELKGSQLKYYKPNRKTLKGSINLDNWCKLTKGPTPETFQLAAPNKTYHLVCKSEVECNDWLRAIEAAMQLHQVKCSMKSRTPKFSGWAHVNHNGESQKAWCTLKGDSLDLCPTTDTKPFRRISIARSLLEKKRDSIMLDSSCSDLKSVILLQDSAGLTEICPDNLEEKDSWYYHLCVAQSGEDLKLTKTEKLISELMYEKSATNLNQNHWKHSVLNYATKHLLHSLTSLPSASLNIEARKLFQSLKLFMTNKITLDDITYHIHSTQHIISTCFKHPPLQDEFYCQILKQISGHTYPIPYQVFQGWLLLSLVITSFLPIKPKFMWYLQNYIGHHLTASNLTISNFAKFCQGAIKAAQEQGQRQCKPSNSELAYVLRRFAESGATKLDHTIVVPVYLCDGTSPDIEFTPFTSIKGLTSIINKKINMPDTCQTGFAIMCDWPGMDDETCCCPAPESKVVDVISKWSAALEELSDQVMTDRKIMNKIRSQRNIQFTYKRRLFIHSHNGSETDKEAVLLAYQISRCVHSGEYLVSLEQAVSMAAMMTQIEHGDWDSYDQGEVFDKLVREAILLFCPWRLTHLALNHDLSLLQLKLTEHWKSYKGQSKETCSRKYISIAQQWSQYGSTTFQAEEYVSDSNPRRSIWLTVNEKGITIQEQSSMKILNSYSYSEISTFGGSGEDYFMLIVSPQSSPTTGQRSQLPQENVLEKLMFAMPKLKICETTLLIASYIEQSKTSPEYTTYC